MQFVIDLGDAKVWKGSLALGMAVRFQLQATALIDLQLLRFNRIAHRRSGGKIPLIPPLYRSGVCYREEPKHWGLEHFDTIPVVYKRKWGDCDDLGPARAAELRVTGEDPKANIMVKWKRRQDNGDRLYHVVVRRSNVPRKRVDNHQFFLDAKGGVYEDPCRVLGMGRDPIVLAAHAGL